MASSLFCGAVGTQTLICILKLAAHKKRLIAFLCKLLNIKIIIVATAAAAATAAGADWLVLRARLIHRHLLTWLQMFTDRFFFLLFCSQAASYRALADVFSSRQSLMSCINGWLVEMSECWQAAIRQYIFFIKFHKIQWADYYLTADRATNQPVG